MSFDKTMKLHNIYRNLTDAVADVCKLLLIERDVAIEEADLLVRDPKITGKETVISDRLPLYVEDEFPSATDIFIESEFCLNLVKAIRILREDVNSFKSRVEVLEGHVKFDRESINNLNNVVFSVAKIHPYEPRQTPR